MIPIALNLNQQNVLIVGGGKVAFRKAKQFIEEGAFVFVVSNQFDETFKELSFSMIEDVYREKYLENMFLVYAATNQKEVNEKIVLDCEKAHILCGSATYHPKASFYSMASRKVQDMQISLSTGQKLPYSKPLLDELETVLKRHEKQMDILGLIRPYVLSYIEDKKTYFERLFTCDVKFLEFLYRSFIQQKGTIYVYHTTKTKEKYPIDDLVLSIEEFEQIVDLLVFPIEYTIIPLIVSDGFIYRQLKGMMNDNCHLALPLLNDDDDIKRVLNLYKEEHQTLICMLHPRGSDALKKRIASVLQNQGLVYDFNDEMQLNKSHHYRLVLFLMTHGTHYSDLKKTVDTYKKQGYNIELCPIIGQNIDVIEMLKRS